MIHWTKSDIFLFIKQLLAYYKSNFSSFSSNDDTQQQPGLREKSAGPEIPSAGNKRKYEVVDGHQSASKV